MVKIEAKSFILTMTEKTIKELVEAIEEAKKEKPFLTTPMSNECMSIKTAMIEERKRGIITVLAAGTDPIFKIQIETKSKSNTQESSKYKLFDPKKELPYY